MHSSAPAIVKIIIKYGPDSMVDKYTLEKHIWFYSELWVTPPPGNLQANGYDWAARVLHSSAFITLHACARGKVIGRVVVVVDAKIGKSGDLGT